MTSVKAFTVSGYQNEWSIATARWNCASAFGLQEVGNWTEPSFSVRSGGASESWAATWRPVDVTQIAAQTAIRPAIARRHGVRSVEVGMSFSRETEMSLSYAALRWLS
jgi:hypothetical protein